MRDLEKYIIKRKQTDAEFAKDYDEGFKEFIANKTFANVNWQKSREILAKVPDVEVEDDDQIQ